MYGLTQQDIPSVEVAPRLTRAWGTLVSCVHRPEYALERLELEQGAVIPLHFYLERSGMYFVEEGEVTIRLTLFDGTNQWHRLKGGNTFSIEKGKLHAFHAVRPTTIYFFSSCGHFNDARFAETDSSGYFGIALLASMQTTFDRREKYWGSIESIVSESFAGKRMVLQKDGQSSLEFHCHKTESYYLQSGKLKVGLRVGRGENTSVVLFAGQTFTIMPGLMHMRIALEESVLIEISTRDSDQDSHLVEDGKTYHHKE